MIKAFKKHTTQPWHKVYKRKRVYEHRGKYGRYMKVPRYSYLIVK